MARAGGLPLPTITDDRALGAADIQRSLRFNIDDDAYLQATLGNGNPYTWTLSIWVKKPVNGQHQAILASGDSSVSTMVNFGNSDRLKFTNYPGSAAGIYITTRKFRDPSAWYHIVAIWDSNNSTAGDRIRLYVNGVRETAFDQSDNPNQSQGSVINTNDAGGSTWGEGKHRIGRYSNYADNSGCYYAEVNFVDGQAYDPSYFGFTDPQTGIWMPKRYEGVYGSNGFYLDLSDNSSTTTLGIDKSPNGNDFTLNNLAVTDSFIDTPTNNFCTLNALDKSNDADVRDGGLTLYNNANDQAATGTFAVKSGKWYWEVVMNSNEPEIGIAHNQMPLSGQSVSLPSNGQIALIVTGADSNTNFLRVDGNTTSGTGITGQSGPGTIGIALDADNRKIWFTNTSGSYFNSGNPVTGANAAVDFSSTGSNYPTCAVTPFVSLYQGANIQTTINFGQSSFSYTQPEGYKTLSSKNLRDHLLTSPSIINPEKHFKCVTYTGNASTQKINLGFKPDMIWFKSRQSSSTFGSADSVRGASKLVYQNTSQAEETSGSGRDLASFDDDGFTLGNPQILSSTNGSGLSIVAWCWKAGGAAVSNTDGDQTTQVSVNEKAGFSIVTYTGTGSNTNIGHGLGAAPNIVITKSRSTTGSWAVLDTVGNSSAEYGLFLNDNGGYSSYQGGTYWNDTLPTSTVFRVSSNAATNASGVTYVAYCWTSIPGFSQFGKYTGTGSNDGTFIYTGFRPAWVTVKNTSASNNWQTWDNARETSNVMQKILEFNDASTTDDASSNTAIDFLSNGFKHRTNFQRSNTDGATYLYMAFAEQSGVLPYNTIINAR